MAIPYDDSRFTSGNLVEEIKCIGQEIIDRAEEIASSKVDGVTNFKIIAEVDPDIVPTIRWEYEALNRRYISSYIGRK